MTILFVVESPGKIKKISSFLGSKYDVQASVGIFRDLPDKTLAIDIDNGFQPIYVITKPDVVAKLRSAMKKADVLYIATDLDREGEGIAKSILDVLKPKVYKRLIFNSITKDAILESIKTGGNINEDLVDAQKARRVLDRLFGYLISPLLRKQLGGNLSAGRVQSPATKIIIDKEEEIKSFFEKNKDATFYKVHGVFSAMKASLFVGKYSTDIFKGDQAKISLSKDNPDANVIDFMKKCLKSKFTVSSVSEKKGIRSPSPPFTTSTLQQEANRKFGMSPDSTMKTAQKLYEGGFITYMRTDSVEISEEGHASIKEVIVAEYGAKYYQKNVYKNKSANSQEAHEAIRPTHPENRTLDGIDDEWQQKLYKLISDRTLASQMKPAEIATTTIQITISKFDKESNPFYYFQSQIEKIIFQGFMKIYVESEDDAVTDNVLRGYKGPVPKVGDILLMEEIIAQQEYLRPPPRYSQASIIKKLEDAGIGRPSTFVSTVKTIINRDYVKLTDIEGMKRQSNIYSIGSKNGKHLMQIDFDTKPIIIGKESKKLQPTSLGYSVTNFLVENFPEMMDYEFTSEMENNLDKIANGKADWQEVIKDYYDILKPKIDEISKLKSVAQRSEKLLGVDEDGNEIFASKGKFGPFVKKVVNGKAITAKIRDPLSLETIILAEAIALFGEQKYPIILGKYKNIDIELYKGKFGFYVKYDGQNYAMSDSTDIPTIDEAIVAIEAKNSNVIATFDLVEKGKKIKAVVINGKFGPYIQVTRGKVKANYKIAKNVDIKTLSAEDILTIIASYTKVKKQTGASAKKATAKKTATKKPVKKTATKKHVTKKRVKKV